MNRRIRAVLSLPLFLAACAAPDGTAPGGPANAAPTVTGGPADRAAVLENARGRSATRSPARTLPRR